MWSLGDSAQWMAVTFSYDGLISSLSPGAEQVIGYSAQDLVGRPVTQILAERSVFEVARLMETAKECGSWEGRVVHLDRNGRTFEADGNLSTLTGREYARASFLLVSLLVSQSHTGGNEQAAVREAATKLRTFAHELNNPLAVMMGFTQLIMLNAQCAGKVRADMEKLFSELKRVIQVVERLHTYAVSLQESDRPEVFLKSAGA
jgi:PAS domain S-box-containing protein